MMLRGYSGVERKRSHRLHSHGGRVQVTCLVMEDRTHAARVGSVETGVLTGKRHHIHVGVHPRRRCEVEILQVAWGALVGEFQVGVLQLDVVALHCRSISNIRHISFRTPDSRAIFCVPSHHVIVVMAGMNVTLAFSARNNILEGLLEATDEVVIRLLSVVSI